MTKTFTHPPLQVLINGTRVGILRRQATGKIEFQYGKEWLEWEHAMPVSLSLPLREDKYSGQPVWEVFDNLLPETQHLREKLAQKAKAKGRDAFSLLSAIGRDCVGAMQFLPLDESPAAKDLIQGKLINSKQISELLSDLATTPLGFSLENDFRISLAGVQEKTALLFWKKRWHLPQHSTPTTHILKPQIGRLKNGLDLSQSVENEHVCMTLLKGLGVPTATTAIEEFEGHRVLVVERFDRKWTKDKRLLRIPQEDFCQILSLPASLKYQADGGPGICNLLTILEASDDSSTDRAVFFRSQILFWLLAATDGHAKNFSIHLGPGGGFRLAPLYDVMSIQPLIDRKQMDRKRSKLAMAWGDKNHYTLDSITPRHFHQTARRSNLPSALCDQVIHEIITRIPIAVAEAEKQLAKQIPPFVLESILDGLQKRTSLLSGR